MEEENNWVNFLLNHKEKVEIEPDATILLKEKDNLRNEKINYTAKETGFYRFTGQWFWFLFAYKGVRYEED